MIKMISAAIAMIAIAMPAAAFQLGSSQFRLDNEFESIYSVENKEFTTTLETELNFSPVQDVKFYSLAYFDLNQSELVGTEWGVDYTPSQLKGLTATTAVITDRDFEYVDTIVAIEYKF